MNRSGNMGTRDNLLSSIGGHVQLPAEANLGHSIIECSEDCIKVLDLKGRLKFMSRGEMKTLRIDNLDPYRDMDYKEFWKGSDYESADRAIQDALNGKTGRFRGYCPARDGTPKWWDVTVTPMTGIDDKTTGLLVVSRDITEQKKTEDALHQSEEKYRNLFEFAPDPIFIIDPATGSIINVNRKAAERLGYSREELQKMTMDDIDLFMDPSRRIALTEEIMRRGSVEYEHTHRARDGTEIPVKVSSRIIEYGGNQVIQSFARDISQRKNMEDSFKWDFKINTALATISSALIDPASTIKDISEIVLEWSKIITGSRHGYVSFIDPDSGDNISYTLSRMMAEGCNLTGRHDRFAFPAGPPGIYGGLWGHSLNTRRPFYTNDPSIHPSCSGPPEGHIPLKNFLSVPAMMGNTMVGQIALANSDNDYKEHDVSAIMRLAELYALSVQRMFHEKSLARANEELEQKVEERTSDLIASLQEKETLLKEIHHRVKNNMQIIASLLSLQALKISDQKAQEVFYNSVNRIYSMALVHEKLYHTKNLARINFKDYINELLSELLCLYGVKETCISSTLDIEDISLGINTAVPCGLILNEIITNSIKHAFKPGYKGKIAVRFVLDPSGHYLMEISDNGIGIPDEFDLKSPKTLGLELTSTLVQQLEGAVKLDKSGGTKYTITFPPDENQE